MKVVLLKPHLVAKTNGGEISMIERLRWLKSQGVEVQIHIALSEVLRTSSMQILEEMNTPLRGSEYEVDDINCSVVFSPRFHSENLNAQKTTEDHFQRILDREQPDLVWAHYTDFFATTAAIRHNPENAWIDLTDNEFPRQAKLDEIPSIAPFYRGIRNVMVASRFMEMKARESLPWAAPILIPNIIESLREAPVERRPEAWVFVNPTYVKGADFALELALKLPSEKFIFVGNWISERPRLLPSNVEFLPRQNSLREIFKRAKGLLMPSIWDEAFGRMPLEAMAAGVLVISSDRGALPETVGRGGICLPLDLNRWIDAMSHRETHSDARIQAGFARVLEYRDETEAIYKNLQKRFEKFLKRQAS